MKKNMGGRIARAEARLTRKLGERKVVSDPDIVEKYSTDESGLPPSVPPFVVFPESTSDVSFVMKVAEQEQVPVTARGGGTGKSGGAIPVGGSFVVSFEKMNQIEEVSRQDFVTFVRPGLILKQLHDAVEGQGLFYPPDPASLDSCSVGGNVAENAGGPRAFKYGVTLNYVVSLEFVTIGGSVIKAGSRTIKQVSGYSIVPLMVGSEGTLAFFTLIGLRLIPLPPALQMIVATFPSSVAGSRSAYMIFHSSIFPRTVEFVDERCFELMRHMGGISVGKDSSSLLIVELDGQGDAVSSQVEKVGEVLQRAGADEVLLLTGASERNRVWNARRRISEYLKQKYRYKISDDISVPRGRIADMQRRIEEICSRAGLCSAVFGHAGDGNLHVNIVWHDQSQSLSARRARDEIMAEVIRMNGCISGEHGVGISKKKYLEWEHSRHFIEIQKKIKGVFDPAGLVNPGKIF